MVMFIADDDKWHALVQRDRQSNGVFFMADLYRRLPKAKFRDPDPDYEEILVKVLAVIETPHSRRFELPLDIQGTAFQRSVWDALQKIALGSTESYTEIAARIGNPSASPCCCTGMRGQSGCCRYSTSRRGRK